MGKIIALHRKPVKKQAAEKIDKMKLIKDFGPEGDAYGAPGERQISILGEDDIRDLSKDIDKGICIRRFTPNLTISGSSSTLEKGKLYKIGNIEIKISEAGKKCHKGCPLTDEKKICLLPKTARFGSILTSGTIYIEDKIREII